MQNMIGKASRGKGNGMQGEPPDKRRKITSTSGPSDPELWDDGDDEFTEDVLVNIDNLVASSQQVAPSRPGSTLEQCRPFTSVSAGLNRSIGRGTPKSLSASELQSGSKVSSSSERPRGSSAPLPGSSPASQILRPPKLNFIQETPKAIPAQDKTSKTKIGSYRDNSFKQLTPTAGTTGSGKISPDLPSSSVTRGGVASGNRSAEFGSAQIEKLKEECCQYKKELQKLKEAQYGKDGQIKILRDNLSRKDVEITRLKQDRVEEISRQERERSQKEQDLEREVERLSSQLTFKEQEIGEIQGLYKKMERQLRTGHTANSPVVGSAQASPKPATSQVHSPVRSTAEHSPSRNRDQGPLKSPGRPGFPTRHSFMAQESSPTKEKQPNSDRGGPVNGSQGAGKDKASTIRRQRKHLLPVSHSKGVLKGPHLVSKLLCCNTSNGVEEDECLGGLTVLLQGMPAPVDLAGINFERDVTTMSLTPTQRVSSSRCSSLTQSMESSSSWVSSCQLQPESLSMAHQAMATLLQPQQAASTDSSLLLLPLIEDYLTAYLHFTSHKLEPLLASPAGSGRSHYSSSMDSSGGESVAASLDSLQLQGMKYANNLESCVVNALAVLKTLVSYCGSVRETVVGEHPHSVAGYRGMKDNHEAMETGTSDQEKLQATSEGDLRSSQAVRCGILQKLFSLACPLLHLKQPSNGKICVQALQVLTVLASSCSLSQLNRFECVLSQDALPQCLDEAGLELPPHTKLSLALAAIQLLTALLRSPHLLPLMCTASEECLWMLMYHYVSLPPSNFSAAQRTALTSDVLGLVSAVVTLHEGGVGLLAEASCHCSITMVSTLVQILHRELQEYKSLTNPSLQPTSHAYQHHATASLCVLRQGVSLLHTLALHDPHFTQHYRQQQQAEHQYVELVCGMERVYRQMGQEADTEAEVVALQELWDFDQEYPEEDMEEDVDSTPALQDGPANGSTHVGLKPESQANVAQDPAQGQLKDTKGRRKSSHPQATDVITID